MYQQCPKCGYQRQAGDIISDDICPRCGLVFSKYMQQRFKSESTSEVELTIIEPRYGVVQWLLHVDEGEDPMVWWGRLAAYLLFFIWGGHFIFMDMNANTIGTSFMHNINLVFHEAGHVIFRLFGEFMMVLGGSLMQVLVPLIVMGTFLWQQRNPFAASIGLWWTGQSLMDVAPYINDARDRQLTLLGGGTGEDRPWMHDWHNIFSQLGWLKHDHRIAAGVDAVGEGLVLVALAWGGTLLYRQYRLGRR